MTYSKKYIVISVGIAFILLLALAVNLILSDAQKSRLLEEKYVNDQLQLLASKISYEINSRMYLNLGLKVYFEEKGEVNIDDFRSFATRLKDLDPYIRNITLIKDTTILDVVPIEGNEAALGFDLLNSANQKNIVQEVIANEKMIIEGPVQLVQGGEGIINRVPILLNGQYWGMVSVVLNLDDILVYSGFYNDPNIYYAIEVEDDMPTENGVGQTFENEKYVSYEIKLHQRTWILKGVPKNGWENVTFWLWVRIGVMVFILASIGIGIIVLVNTREKLKAIASIDPLTELGNRYYLFDILPRLIEDTKKNNGKLALLFIDVNEFKHVNDQYGHIVGDYLLKEVSKRLRDTFKDHYVIRYGGDEFIVILPRLKSRLEINKHLSDLVNHFEAPFVHGEVIHYINVTVGASYYPDDAMNADDLIQKADVEMYQRK